MKYILSILLALSFIFPVSVGADECKYSCEGQMGTVVPEDGLYYATSFGCWMDRWGAIRSDTEDGCIPGGYWKAVDAHLCRSWMTGTECEVAIQYFTAGSSRYPYMTRLLLTNPENGKSVVAVVLDGGPHCWVENEVQFPVMDISVPTSLYLFESSSGWSEKQLIHVEVVPNDTPLGPTEIKPEGEIVLPEPEYKGTPYVIADNVRNAVNVRVNPDSNSERVTVIYKGAILDIVELRDGWGKLAEGGWVWMEYLKGL